MADPDLHLSGGGGVFEGLTINVEFCEDNSGRSKKMRYISEKNNGGGGGGKGGGGGPPVPSPGFATDLFAIQSSR